MEEDERFLKFIRIYNNAMNDYFLGNWIEAQVRFEKCLKLMPKDGPAQAILDYIASFNYKPKVARWMGFRILDEK